MSRPLALAYESMIHHERATYEQWLSQPQLIRKMVRTHFVPAHESFAWGKWNFARGLPNAWLFLGVWIVGGLYALFSAPSMAELGAAIPRSGGQYNFSRRAIGEYAGFIVGWSDWLSTCGTAAAVAIVVSEYSGSLFPILAGPQKIKLLSVTIIAGFGVLQWRGIRWGSGAQLLTAAIKTAGFLLLVPAR